jgi:hypothetical protein
MRAQPALGCQDQQQAHGLFRDALLGEVDAQAARLARQALGASGVRSKQVAQVRARGPLAMCREGAPCRALGQ